MGASARNITGGASEEQIFTVGEARGLESTETVHRRESVIKRSIPPVKAHLLQWGIPLRFVESKDCTYLDI